MKNSKNILIILLAIIIVILMFFLVKKINSNNNNSTAQDKIISEIKYMDNRLTKLLNGVNNIVLENYKISVTKTSTNSENQTNNETSTESNSSSQTNNSTSKTSEEKYGLKEERILTEEKDTDWETIKNEIEILYSSVPTITLDLYNMNVNQDEILNFNKELDELTISAKNQNKEDTLIKLANLYRYLPAYASNFSNNEDYTILLETKSNVFNSYVFVDLEKWDEANNFIKKAVESYTKKLSNLNNTEDYYDTQKVYIILNELQNAVEIKDKDVFLIKYKNFFTIQT